MQKRPFVTGVLVGALLLLTIAATPFIERATGDILAFYAGANDGAEVNITDAGIVVPSGNDVCIAGGACLSSGGGGGSDTNAGTICTGTGTYLDGEGNCDPSQTIVDQGLSALPDEVFVTHKEWGDPNPGASYDIHSDNKDQDVECYDNAISGIQIWAEDYMEYISLARCAEVTDADGDAMAGFGTDYTRSGPGVGADGTTHSVSCNSGDFMTELSIRASDRLDGDITIHCQSPESDWDGSFSYGVYAGETWNRGPNGGRHIASCGEDQIARGIRAFATSRLDGNLQLLCANINVN